MQSAPTGRRTILSNSLLWDIYRCTVLAEPYMVIKHVPTGRTIPLTRVGKLYFVRAKAVPHNTPDSLRISPTATHESVNGEQGGNSAAGMATRRRTMTYRLRRRRCHRVQTHFPLRRRRWSAGYGRRGYIAAGAA